MNEGEIGEEEATNKETNKQKKQTKTNNSKSGVLDIAQSGWFNFKSQVLVLHGRSAGS